MHKFLSGTFFQSTLVALCARLFRRVRVWFEGVHEHDIDVAAVIKLDIVIDIDQVSHTPLDGVWPLPGARHQPHLSSRAGLLLS